MRCPRSPAKNRPSGLAAPRAARKRSFGDAEILRLVDDGEVERRLRPPEFIRQPAEHVGRVTSSFGEAGPHALEMVHRFSRCLPPMRVLRPRRDTSR